MSGNLLIVLLILGGWSSGKIASRLRLPSVLGMTIFGIGLGYFAGSELPPGFDTLIPYLKSLALVIILLRAGLGLSLDALKRAGRTAILLALLPCLFEGAVVSLLFRFLGGLPWFSALTGGALLAAVSPAVVIPSMLELRDRGFGAVRQIPTAVLAGATLDNVVVITLFTLFASMGRGGESSLAASLFSLPYGIVGGIIPGLAVGWLLAGWFRRHAGQSKEVEHGLLLIGASFLLLESGDMLHTTALLGVIAAGSVLLARAEEAAHELSSMLKQAWIAAEIVLFVLIGLSVDLRSALSSGLFALGLVTAGLILRSCGVWLATIASGFTRRERLFCVVAYLPKATVQAALGSVPLFYGLSGGELILSTSVIAILITAPLGLILLRSFGEELLDQ